MILEEPSAELGINKAVALCLQLRQSYLEFLAQFLWDLGLQGIPVGNRVGDLLLIIGVLSSMMPELSLFYQFPLCWDALRGQVRSELAKILQLYDIVAIIANP